MPIKHLQPKKDAGDWKVKKISSSRPKYKRQKAVPKDATRESSQKALGYFIKKTNRFSTPKNSVAHTKSISRRRRRNFPFAKYAIIGIIFIFLLGSIGSLGVFAWYSKDLPEPDRLIERSIAQSTKIYDRTGEHILYEIHGDQRRTLVDLEDLPEYVKWATITTEDRHFYEHHGFNVVAIIKGSIIDPLLGKRARGGSTLTQQFVKNAILTDERRISRKIKELILSIQIEKRFTKDQILKMYLNEIPYGSTAYGIEAASQTYLGKSAKNLSLSEAVTLAAMPKKPSYYMNHQDELIGRRDYLLDSMVEEGHINKQQRDEAKEEKVVLRSRQDGITAPHFVMYIKELLSQKYGETVAEQGGLSVYTTLDIEKQKIAEEVVAKHGKTNAKNYDASNAALISIDTNTGDILAMVGSRDYFNDEIDGQVNVVLKPRQPGSSIKPLVYVSAFEKGYTADTILFDVKTNFAASGPTYEPNNYDGKTLGPVTIRKALAGSLNIPAVKALYLTGLNDVIELAGKTGYTTLDDKDRFGLSFVLGGGEVKLIEHANAFAVFSQDGIARKNRAILRIEDNQRRVIEETKIDKGSSVIDKQAVRLLNDIMSDNAARSYAFGASNYLTLGNIPVAAKTGTTNDNRDGWLMGYTPSVITGVWVGNNDNSKMAGTATGSTVAAPIWNEYMRRVLENETVEYFIKPQEIETEKAILNGEWKKEINIRINKITGLPADDDTPDTFVEEKNYQEAHNILHYVVKDDPRGDIPENPTNNSQYSNWEKSVQEWLNENEVELNLPPKQDENNNENSIKISISSPKKNERININELSIKTSVETKNDLSKIEYYLDDLYVGSTTKAINFSPNLNNISDGSQLVSAIAYDSENSYGSAQRTININNSSYNSNNLTVAWLSSLHNQTFSVGQKINLGFSAKSSRQAESLKIYIQTPDGKKGLVATSFGNNVFNEVYLSWNKTQQTGNYTLWIETDSGIKSVDFNFQVK